MCQLPLTIFKSLRTGTVSFICVVWCLVMCLEHGIYAIKVESISGRYTLNILTVIRGLFTTGVLVTFSYYRILEITFSTYPRPEDLMGP